MGIKLILKNATFQYPIANASLPVVEYQTFHFDNPLTSTNATLGKKIEIEFVGTGHVYYTLDGSTPTDASNVYTEVISLESDVIFKAIHIEENGNESDVVTFDTSEYAVMGNKTMTPTASEQGVSNVALLCTHANPLNENAFVDVKVTPNMQITLANYYIAGVNVREQSLPITGLTKTRGIKADLSNIVISPVLPNTLYSQTGENEVSVDYEVKVLTKTQKATNSASDVTNSKVVLFNNLDNTKKYGVIATISNVNVTPGQTAINCVLRDSYGGGAAAGYIEMKAAGTYLIPIELGELTEIGCQCYNGTCDISAVLYELT